MDQAGYEKVLERLLAIEIQGAKIETKLDGNHKAFRDFEAEIKAVNHRLEATVYGNGKPGLTSRMDAKDEALKSVAKEMASHTFGDKLLFGTIITILLFILGKVYLG